MLDRIVSIHQTLSGPAKLGPVEIRSLAHSRPGKRSHDQIILRYSRARAVYIGRDVRAENRD